MQFFNFALTLLLTAALGSSAAPVDSTTESTAQPDAAITTLGAPNTTINGVEISQETIAELFKLGLKSKGAPIDSTASLAKHQLWTRSDITAGKCSDIILIFARGTFEPGNMGWIVGGGFADELAKREPSRVVVQGVEPYDASVVGYLIGGEQKGIDSMATLIQRAARQCPNGKIVISGYSQGAQVAHKGAAKVPSSIYSQIAGAVVFGDPFNGQPFPGTINKNVKTFCRVGDLICLGIPLPIGAHLEYGADAAAAAQWVANLL